MKRTVQRPIYFNDGAEKVLIANSISEIQSLVVAEDYPGTFQRSLKKVQSIRQLKVLLANYQLSF